MKLADLKPRLVVGVARTGGKTDSQKKWQAAHDAYESGENFRISPAKVASWKQCPAAVNSRLALWAMQNGIYK